MTQGNLDLAALWSKPERVLDQISESAVKKEWVCEYFRLAFTPYRDLPIFGGDFVKGLNFLERAAAVECRSIHLLLGRLGAGEKEKIIDDTGKPFAFGGC